MRRAIGPVALRVPGGGPGEGKGVFDGLVGDLAVAGDAVGVDTEQDVDAVAGAGGDLGGRRAGGQPQGQGGVPQVVRAAGQRRGG